MECGRESSLYAKEVKEQGSKLRHENFSAVTDDGVWKAIILHYHVDYHFRQSWSIDNDLDWLIIHYLGQEVDYNKN